jgi:hypothetical protein
MNKQVMAIAVCLALQPVVSLGAETMIQPGVKERDSKQSFEIQRDRVPKQLAKSCIPMRPGNPNGVASQEANKPGGVRNDCEPGTQPRAMPDGSRLVKTFPDGARLYATTRNGDVQKYSAIDQRGRALKVEILQNPPKGMLSGPNNAIDRGKQRAEEQHKRFMEQARAAIESGEIVGKGCWIVIFDSLQGGGAGGVSYGSCPKGA